MPRVESFRVKDFFAVWVVDSGTLPTKKDAPVPLAAAGNPADFAA